MKTPISCEYFIISLAIVCFYYGSNYEMNSGDVIVKGTFNAENGEIKTTDYVKMISSAPEFVCLREKDKASYEKCIGEETAKAEKDFKRWYLSDFRKKGNIYKDFIDCKKK